MSTPFEYSATSSVSTKSDVILKTSADWEVWIMYIQMVAETARVWDLINPSLHTEPDLPQPPIRPTPAMLKPSAASEADLSEA